MGVHGLEAVLLPIGLHHGEELLAAGDAGHLLHNHGVVRGGEEEFLQSGNPADLLLHLPQGLEGIPVPVGGGDVDLSDQHVVGPGGLGGVGKVRGGLELGQVDDPVNPEGLALHVQDVLHVDHDLRQALVLEIEVQNGVLHVLQAGHILLIPAVHEGVRVDGHDLDIVVKHGADLVGVHLRGNDGGVDIAADLLGDPGLADGGAEALVHVRAVRAPAALGVPPAADVEVQGGDGVGTVEVVIEPHQALLGLVLPFDGEALVSEFRGQNLGSVAHLAFSFSLFLWWSGWNVVGASGVAWIIDFGRSPLELWRFHKRLFREKSGKFLKPAEKTLVFPGKIAMIELGIAQGRPAASSIIDY